MMESIFFYMIAALLCMLLIGYLLERYGLVIVAGLVLAAFLYIYLPPAELRQALGLAANVPVVPVPEPISPKDSLINVSPSKKDKAPCSDQSEKTKPDTLYIVDKRRINTSPFQEGYDPNEPTLSYIPEGCEIKPDILNHYVLAESVFQEEAYAMARVETLKSHGFSNAFYIYLPCYKTRIADERKLFAVIMERPCKTLDSIHQEKSSCIRHAEQRHFVLISKDKILKIEPKNG